MIYKHFYKIWKFQLDLILSFIKFSSEFILEKRNYQLRITLNEIVLLNIKLQ